MEATRRGTPGTDALVGPNQSQQRTGGPAETGVVAGHRAGPRLVARSRARRRSARTAAKGTPATEAPAVMTMAPAGTPSAAASSARAARRRRRMRLRTTAVPVRRPMANATRQRSTGSVGVWRMLTGPDRPRRPCSRTRRRVRRSRSGAIRRTGGPDPCCAGCAPRRARRGSTCACGTRGAWTDGGRWAGRCASLLSSAVTAASSPQAPPGGRAPMDGLNDSGTGPRADRTGGGRGHPMSTRGQSHGRAPCDHRATRVRPPGALRRPRGPVVRSRSLPSDPCVSASR